MNVEISVSKNPLENYKTFNQFNFINLIDAWVRYIEEGIRELYAFIKGILNKYGFIDVVYDTCWGSSFSPFFSIIIPKKLTLEDKNNLWEILYDELYEFSIKNDILPSFSRINFDLDFIVDYLIFQQF